MFIAMLAVIALVDYVVIFCCIVNMVGKPMVETAKTTRYISEGEQTINNADMGFVCNDEEFDRYDKEFNAYDKDFNSYLEEQNSRIALLSLKVNEILSNIDSIIERSEAEQRVSL